jgi:hypothetical protein
VKLGTLNRPEKTLKKFRKFELLKEKGRLVNGKEHIYQKDGSRVGEEYSLGQYFSLSKSTK